MKIMILNDGVTYTAIQGCQIVEIDQSATADDIDIYLERLNMYHEDVDNAKIIGRFDEDGTFLNSDSK